jgi:hypothetical protein
MYTSCLIPILQYGCHYKNRFCFLQPLLALGKQLGIKSLSLISSCSHSIKKFRQIAVEMEIPVGHILQITEQSKVIGDVVMKFLEESVSMLCFFFIFYFLFFEGCILLRLLL